MVLAEQELTVDAVDVVDNRHASQHKIVLFTPACRTAQTEALIADIGKIGALKVISRTSVMRYKDTHKSLPEIAHELNVDAVIEASVLHA